MAPARPLTEREWQVFDLVTGPHGSRKAAAAELGISESTVDSHLLSVFRKLNVETIGGPLGGSDGPNGTVLKH